MIPLLLALLAVTSKVGARDLLAVTALGRDYGEMAALAAASFARARRACPGDADIDFLVVGDAPAPRAPWAHAFAPPRDAHPDAAYMARFDTVRWPRFWHYARVIQVDADTLVAGCLAPLYEMITPRQMHAHPALYDTPAAWSLPGHPRPRTPFNSGALAYEVSPFMAGHLLLMRAWIADEIARHTLHYVDQSFVNVYMDRHGLVNTSGALTPATLLVRPSHAPAAPPYAQPLVHFIAAGLNKTRAKTAEMRAYLHAHLQDT